MTRVPLRLDARAAEQPVSRSLYGLFLEDLNFGADGGLNANLVNNHSFEGVYLQAPRRSDALALLTRRKPRRLLDHTRHWSLTGGTLSAHPHEAEGPATGTFARLQVTPGAVLVNDGYPDRKSVV